MNSEVQCHRVSVAGLQGLPSANWCNTAEQARVLLQPNWPPHPSLQVHTLASRSSVRLVRASACRSRRWKSLGDMMAGEKKRRHRKLVTAMKGTFWKRVERLV